MTFMAAAMTQAEREAGERRHSLVASGRYDPERVMAF
jgi:hypothetical protein